jgi:DNA-binding transcriptional regulator YiaG
VPSVIDKEAADDAARPDEPDATTDTGWESFEMKQAEPTREEPIQSVYPEDRPPLKGADLAAWRTRHGLTQQAAADRLGVRQGTVSKAEGRSGAALGPALRDALARALAAE